MADAARFARIDRSPAMALRRSTTSPWLDDAALPLRPYQLY
jgi:hypothetical protein